MNHHLLKVLGAALGCVLFVLPSSLGQQNPLERYIIELKPGHDPGRVAAAHGLRPEHVYARVLNGFAARLTPGKALGLANDPSVAHISVDHAVFAFKGKPTPPPPPAPGGQTTPAGVARIGAASVAQTGQGIGVAILDTGLDLAHQDLRISALSFVSPGFADYTTTAQDDAGHGTHVGGIVAAADNTIDVIGVAPGATLYAVKVLNNAGSGYDSDIISGLDWVAANAAVANPPIRVINMSLGRTASEDDSAIHIAIANVVGLGVTVVVAAGNDPAQEVSQVVPAGFPEVIAVASTTALKGTSNSKRVKPVEADTASYFTTDGPFNPITLVGVAISAPGEKQEDVDFPFINSVGILSTALGGGTTRLSGTSMAAPHATGVVALLLEKQPALTPADIKARIMAGDKVGQAPLNSPTSSYTYDGEREGILHAPTVLGP